MRPILVNGFLVAAIFSFLCFLSYPLLMNADFLLGWEEAQLINRVMDMVQGGPVFFYYEGVSYQGILDSLFALPFFYIFGVNTLALKLSSLGLFALYIWSCFILAKLIDRTIIWVVLIFLLFPPISLLLTTYTYGSYALICFLGNIILILFCRARSSKRVKPTIIFFLFFVIGLSIYTFTYSILYISSIFILFLLSQPDWDEFRSAISIKNLKQLAWIEQKPKGKWLFIFDTLIVAFVFGVLFSYVFGGFGIDIGGISVFQVNNLHKPVFQLLAIILLRILVYRKDIFSMWEEIKRLNSEEIQGERRRIIGLCGAGFLLGLSPRIASILMGETSRGGQGFDVDFNPIKLIAHIEDVFVRTLPSLFSLENSFQGLTFAGSVEGATAVLVIPLLLLLIASAVSFCFDNLDSVKKIFTLRMVKFNPDNIFILMPVLILLANTLVQNGSQPRYLFPLFGTSVLWIGIFTRKFQDKIKGLSLIVLAVWSGFYSMANYKAYNDKNLLNGFKVQKFKKLEIYNLIEFLESKQIKVAYSDYWVSQVGSFLSKGNINISEYSNNPVAKKQKRKSLRSSEFAIIAWEKDAIIFQKFLLKNNIAFESHEVAGYKVYWRFSGDQNYINKLRSLISGK